MLKYLRIAGTALSLTACVLLVALWARTYWWWEVLSPILTARIPSMQQGIIVYNDIQTRNTEPIPDPLVNRYLPQCISFSFNGFSGLGSTVPVWAVFPPVAAIAVIAWLPWRFSLRTLLMATTLVAVGLGMVVMSS